MTNQLTGYHAFKAIIDDAAEAFGPRTREALAQDAETILRQVLTARLSLGPYTRPSWTLAGDPHFEEAAERFERTLSPRPFDTLAQAPFERGALHLRKDEKGYAGVDLVAREFSVPVLLTSEHPGYDTRARANVTKLSPFITDTGCRIASGCDSTYVNGAGNKSTTCKTPAATFKSAKGLIKDFFKVELVDVEVVGG